MADTKTEPGIAVVRDGNGNLSCVLVDPFEVGDCQMNGGARVDMPVLTDLGATVVIWDADVFSRHPQAIFNDQWHQSFNFKTRRGTSILKVGFDGPTLNHADQVKLSISRSLFCSIQTFTASSLRSTGRANVRSA